MRKEISRYWGDDKVPDREAVVYHNTEKKLYEVDFLSNEELVETREMVTQYNDDKGMTVHSMRYAEDAAENWCLGIIP